jgi:hypothetical protein
MPAVHFSYRHALQNRFRDLSLGASAGQRRMQPGICQTAAISVAKGPHRVELRPSRIGLLAAKSRLTTKSPQAVVRCRYLTEANGRVDDTDYKSLRSAE